MPPIAEITKEKIVEAAFEAVREGGLEALTARNIALRLKCSTQPIYSACGSMENVRDDVYHMAVQYALESMKQYKNENNKPALNLAIGFLYFAKNEKQLFRTVYLSGHKKYLHMDEFIGEGIYTAYMRYSPRLEAVAEDRLRNIFLKLYIYMIGIGTMIHTETLELSFDEATEMIREMNEALLLKEGLSNS